jgi:hypothetical protein
MAWPARQNGDGNDSSSLPSPAVRIRAVIAFDQVWRFVKSVVALDSDAFIELALEFGEVAHEDLGCGPS